MSNTVFDRKLGNDSNVDVELSANKISGRRRENERIQGVINEMATARKPIIKRYIMGEIPMEECVVPCDSCFYNLSLLNKDESNNINFYKTLVLKNVKKGRDITNAKHNGGKSEIMFTFEFECECRKCTLKEQILGNIVEKINPKFVKDFDENFGVIEY